MSPVSKSRARDRRATRTLTARLATERAHVKRSVQASRKLVHLARQADRAAEKANDAILEFLIAQARRRGLSIVTAEQREEQRRRLDDVIEQRDRLSDRVAVLERELTAATAMIDAMGAAGSPAPAPEPGALEPILPGVIDGLLVDPRAWFFHVIGREENAPAPDWKPLLESLPARGMGTNPKPGQKQRRDAPWCGVTVMIDAGGNARGRIWLPTTDAIRHDGNDWFTREIQVIAEPEPGRMVWAWIDKGGALYTPWPATPARRGYSNPTLRRREREQKRAAGADKGV